MRDRMSVLLSQFEKIPRRLTMSVFWGGLLMAAGIALVLARPVSRDLRHQAELHVLQVLDGKRKSLDSFFQDSLRAASEYRYIENSFKLDPELSGWWQIPGLPADPPTIPDIAQVDLSRVKGMVRYSDQQQISGNPFGISETPLLPPGSQPVLHNVYAVNGTRAVSILFPLSKGPDGKDGVDMVFCDASELTSMLAGVDFPGGKARLALMDTSDHAIRFLTPPTAETGDAESAENLLRKAVRVARSSTGKPWSFVDLNGNRLAVTQAPLSSSDWAVMLALPARDMYQKTRLKMVGMSVIAVCLALFLSSFSLIVSRPFGAFLKRMDQLLSRERSKRHEDARELQVVRRLFNEQKKIRQLVCSLALAPSKPSAEAPDNPTLLKTFAFIHNADTACLWHMPAAQLSVCTHHFPPDEQRRLTAALRDLLHEQEKIVITDTTSARLPPSFIQAADHYHWRSLIVARFNDAAHQPWGIMMASKKNGTLGASETTEWLVFLGALLVCRGDHTGQ